MLPSVAGIELKLKRAYQQIDSLKGELNAFLDRRTYVPTLQPDRVPGRTIPAYVQLYTIRVTVNEECKPEWSVIVGEIVHDLRSALDHLIYQLVIYATGEAPPDESRTQFPVFLTDARFKSNTGTMLKGVGKENTAAIERFQPYSTGEKEGSPLWHLNKLSNIDKHRTLHLAGGTVQSFKFDFPPLVAQAEIDQKRIRDCGAFEHNAELASGRIKSEIFPFPSDQVQMNALMSFDVVFDQRTAVVGGWAVYGTLMNIADRSSDIIAHVAGNVLSLSFKL